MYLHCFFGLYNYPGMNGCFDQRWFLQTMFRCEGMSVVNDDPIEADNNVGHDKSTKEAKESDDRDAKRSKNGETKKKGSARDASTFSHGQSKIEAAIKFGTLDDNFYRSSSVSNKSWADMMEEDELMTSRSAPPRTRKLLRQKAAKLLYLDATCKCAYCCERRVTAFRCWQSICQV
jgi:hypothetical protein